MIKIARPKEFDRITALQTAMRVFWARGYEGTSVDDLITAMEISKSSLYQSFGNKQDLFLEAINFYLEFTDRKRNAVFSNATSVKEGMSTFLHGLTRFILAPDHPRGCFYTNTATALGTLDQQIHTVILRGSNKMEDDFYQFFLQGQLRGEFAPGKDLHALAKFFVGLVRGISVFARIQNDPKALEDRVEVGLQTLD